MNSTFKALSDSTRRRILELLIEKNMTAGEIFMEFNISKSSISHHLSILTNADLVFREKIGQHVMYSINTTAFQDITKWFFTIMNKK